MGIELDELAAIEDLLIERISGRAMLVGVITTKSMREFVLYTDVASWIQEVDHAMQSDVSGHTVQVMAKKDPGWAVYREFVK